MLRPTPEEQLQHYLQEVLDPQQEIVVLLSGGVDSSVALAALKRYGCTKLSAYYLKIWFEDSGQFLGNCPWEEDLDYAAKVCEQLDVPLQILPMQEEYYRYVVQYTLEELRRGRTPSPDLFCNQYVKFGAFRKAVAGQNPLIATGHYALLRPHSELALVVMQQAPDQIKDQSYFLSRLSQQQLQNLIFPLGCLQKSQVRHLAEEWGLATARRKDSQGVCFLGKIKFRNFTQHYLGEQPGPIVDIVSHEVLGEHHGLWFHTIGQRQGLGLGGGPWYISGKDVATRTLYVRHAQQQELRQDFVVHCGNWLLQEPPFSNLQDQLGSLSLKLRHGPAKIECRLQEQQPGYWDVHMAQGDRGVAPGQFAVFYRDDICLGSATIA